MLAIADEPVADDVRVLYSCVGVLVRDWLRHTRKIFQMLTMRSSNLGVSCSKFRMGIGLLSIPLISTIDNLSRRPLSASQAKRSL